jgi:hypothetical protein
MSRAVKPSPLDRCVYLVNSTPKYFYLLPLHFALLNRYGGAQGRVLDKALATEEPDHPIVKRVEREFDVRIIPLKKEDAGFLDSRRAALAALDAEGKWDYVLPVQEDFLMDRTPGWNWIENGATFWLEPKHKVASVRLMPCPGPQREQADAAAWWELFEGWDTYGFTFQATLWRLDACLDWYTLLCRELEAAWPVATTASAKRIEVEVRGNFAENPDGQQLFWKWSRSAGWRHTAWRRAGPWSNAVYMSPWPYRPTAIVKGRLEPWARELAEREGFGADVRGVA